MVALQPRRAVTLKRRRIGRVGYESGLSSVCIILYYYTCISYISSYSLTGDADVNADIIFLANSKTCMYLHWQPQSS